MAAVLRVARSSAREAAGPAAASWLLLFGYQWAFYTAYSGHLPTVFNYWSGILGDGLIIPAINVAGYVLLRELSGAIPWRRLPLYAALGFGTATAAFLMQAHLDWVNWSMPVPFQWSDVGQFHFFVMAGEMTFLYLTLATAVSNWRLMLMSSIATRSFLMCWIGVACFAVTLAADYAH